MNDRERLKKMNMDWLKATYFSDPARHITLPKGAVLLRENEANHKLFLVLEGCLAGYLGYESRHPFEAFRSTPDHFVGVYSFFSDSHISYSTVIAEEPTLLAYIDHHSALVEGAWGNDFAEHFLPVVVDEIYMRQLLTQKMTLRNEEAMRKLFQTEKMALLGQLAAGLAHELNNAVGVIQRQAEWLSDWTNLFVAQYGEPGMVLFFRKGLIEGHTFSSSELRQRRREIEDLFDIPSNLARQVAASGISNEEIKSLGSDFKKHLKQYLPFFEAGLALHDMLAASRHASRVVRSVKDLGVSSHDIQVPTDLAQTIRDAILLLKDPLKGIQWNLDLEEGIFLQTSPGELVQVWVNLIKNACESLHASEKRNAQIRIKNWQEGNIARVQITDNGPGITPELIERIFQPNVTTKVEGLSFGLGLGLSIVQRIVENRHGAVTVKSRPGETVFTVTLPLYDF